MVVAGLAARPVRAGSFRDTPVPWRDYDETVFEEARSSERGVFLVLTAPWTWDHFLLPDRLFRDPEILSRLGKRWIPVLADASVHPELRSLYSIRTGLLPSFHFLDGNGAPLASFPPMGAEELTYYLDEHPNEAGEPATLTAPDALAVRAGHLVNRCGRLLLDLYDRRERRLPAIHADLDFSDLLFFAELAGVRLRRRSHALLERDAELLLESDFHDRRAGGIHRSAALADQSVVHREKLLRMNAEAAEMLAAWFRRSGRAEGGEAAAGILRFLNGSLRVGDHALYAGSLSADVYSADGELKLEGEFYYRRDLAGRELAGSPARSGDIPAGANYRMQQTLLQFFRTWGDERMRRAIRERAPLLREAAFGRDGSARARVGEGPVGNLRDQGDVGSGLLAEHAITGDPGAIRAAARLAGQLVDRFRDDSGHLLRSVARDAPYPSFAHTAPPAAGWNGVALRFLAELAAVTGDRRWSGFVTDALEEWSDRVPANGDGAAELGRAALRSERGMGVALIDADPGSEEGDRLAKLVLRITTPLCGVRWVDRDDREGVAGTFGVTLEDEPAVYMVWEDAGPACRTPNEFREQWLAAINRAW